MSGLERILLMAALAIGFVVLALGGCFIVILLEPPPTERLWRTSLEASHGLERVGLIWAYRILHRKQNERKKKGNVEKEQRTSRQAVAGSQSLYARRGTSLGTTDSRVGGHLEKSSHDDDNYELFRGSRSIVSGSEIQGSPSGAGSEASAPSSRPAHESGKNRSDPKGGSEKNLSDSAGNGGRAGSLIDEHDAPFWKKLVTHAEELGL